MFCTLDLNISAKYISLRYFNAAGADPDADVGEDHHPETHLIPLVLDVAAGKSKAIKVFGTDYETPDGTCIRDYIHVTDLARAHIWQLNACWAGPAAVFTTWETGRDSPCWRSSNGQRKLRENR